MKTKRKLFFIKKNNRKSKKKISKNIYELTENIIKKMLFQFVSCGIDYETLGYGNFHNKTLNEYVDIKNPIIISSKTKQILSYERISNILKNIKLQEINNNIWEVFIDEIYGNEKLIDNIQLYPLENLHKILCYNLSMPLRSLNVNIPEFNKNMTNKLDRDRIKKFLFELQNSMFKGNYVDFKFKSIDKQLSHLSLFNRHLWKYQYKVLHDLNNITTEGDDNYYIYFWATKIGGPSHGFDIGPQCLYSLLGNARNKVILLYNKELNDYVARSYLRVLKTDNECILFLEEVQFNEKYVYNNYKLKKIWKQYIIEHAYKRSKLLNIKLAIPWIKNKPKKKLRIILDPSDAILEASDYICNKHDWVQLNKEIHYIYTFIMY